MFTNRANFSPTSVSVIFHGTVGLFTQTKIWHVCELQQFSLACHYLLLIAHTLYVSFQF